MYNGNHTQLSLFQTATGVSFPLLQMAVNGTVYGAFRDDMMLIDQTGKQTLLVDVRRDANWRTKVTAEIDRLINLPIARVVSDAFTLDSLQVGQSATRTLSIVNDGRASLTVSGATTDVEGLDIAVTGQTVSEDDTIKVVLTYSPLSDGLHSGSIRITTPGAISNEILIQLDATVLAQPIPRLTSSVEGISLGEVETGRSGTNFVTLENEGNAELVVGIDETSTGIVGTGETTIASGETGRISYRIDLEVDGPYSGTLILNTNDPAKPQLTIPITATGVTIPVEPRADFNGSGVVDFADFLVFAGVFGSSDPTVDLDGSGIVDFAEISSSSHSPSARS
jgi:hypothetical protein